MTENLLPFRVAIPQADLDDLADRLARTRLPQPAPGDDWDYGVPNHYLAETVAHWRTAAGPARRGHPNVLRLTACER